MMDRHFVPGILMQRATEGENSLGTPITTYADYLTIAGYIRPIKPQEALYADKLTTIGTHKLYCNVADIKRGDKVIYDGITYRVKYPHNPMNQNRFLQVDLELEP